MTATPGNLSITPTANADTTALDPLTVLSVLADPMRWRIINLLAPGRVMSGTDIAAELGRSPDAINKHLRVMREAGVVQYASAQDRRYFAYQIAPEVRTTPGLLDFGFCTLRLAQARPDDIAKD